MAEIFLATFVAQWTASSTDRPQRKRILQSILEAVKNEQFDSSWWDETKLSTKLKRMAHRAKRA